MAKKQRPAKIHKVMTRGYAEILLADADWQCELNCKYCPENPCPHINKKCERAIAECYDDARYGDLILGLMGISLPISADVSHFLFYVLYLAAQLGLYVFARNRVECTYAAGYDALRRERTETE